MPKTACFPRFLQSANFALRRIFVPVTALLCAGLPSCARVSDPALRLTAGLQNQGETCGQRLRRSQETALCSFVLLRDNSQPNAT